MLSSHAAEVLATLPPRAILDTDAWLLSIEQQPCASAGCTGTCQVHAGERKGEVINLMTKCTRCEQERQISNVAQWQSGKRTGGKRGRPIERFNLEVVAAQLLNGGTYRSYQQHRDELGLGSLNKGAYRAAERRIEEITKQVVARMDASYMEKYRTGEWKIDNIAGDGSWLNRRNSLVGYYTITDIAQGKIVCEETMIKKVVRVMHGKEVVITPGNYDGTSKGMEGEGCRRILSTFEREKLLPMVKTITTDDDSSVKKMMVEDDRLTHITRKADKGHYIKAFTRKLEKKLGTGKAWEGYAAKMGCWLKRCLCSSHGTGETEEEWRQSYLKEVERQLKFALPHYLLPMCNRGCPCYTVDRKINYTKGEIERMERAMNLPDELQVQILSHLPTKAFVAYTTTCRSLYAIAQDKQYQDHFEHLRWKKKSVPYEEKHKKRFKKVISLFDEAINDIDLWAHPHHTCYNESVNGFRTHDLPKHKTFPSTCDARAALSRLKYNEGSGCAKGLVHKALDLIPNRLQQAAWTRDDMRRETDKKRKASKAFKEQTKANYGRKAKQARHEKVMSKKRGDTYRAAHTIKPKKPAKLPRLVTDAPLTEKMVKKMKCDQVDTEMRARGLVLTYNKKSNLEDKKRRLTLFITDPEGNRHLQQRQRGGRPPKTTGTTPASSTPTGTTPAGRKPASRPPASRTSAGHTPAGSTPAASTSAGHTPAGSTPAASTPTSTTPDGRKPTSSTPTRTTPASRTPAGSSPTSTTPTSRTPNGHKPASSMPTSTTPAGREPVARPLAPRLPVASQ